MKHVLIIILTLFSITCIAKKNGINRKIIHKPKLRLAIGANNGNTIYVTVKIVIHPDGKVNEAIVLKSNTGMGLDRAISCHIKQWRFSKIKSKKSQTAVLKLRFGSKEGLFE